MPSPVVTDLKVLIRSMTPVLNEGTFVFCRGSSNMPIDSACVIASIREPEGWSIVIREADATRYAIAYSSRWAWITLTVNSALESVGLTAAFAAALANEGISCNVIAGLHHDHLFVPEEHAAQALHVLTRLAER